MWRTATNIHVLGKHRGLVVAVGNTDADRSRAGSGRHPCVHGDDHKLVHMIGPFVVQPFGGVDHALRCDVKVGALDEVGEPSVEPGVTVTGNN